jgi:hypothetical protein
MFFAVDLYQLVSASGGAMLKQKRAMARPAPKYFFFYELFSKY